MNNHGCSPLQHIGGEFMPRGGWMKAACCMPSALPGLSAGKRGVSPTDRRLIKTVPEVASVYGKAGRAGLQPSPPLEMFRRRSDRAISDDRQTGRGTRPHHVKSAGLSNVGAADPIASTCWLGIRARWVSGGEHGPGDHRSHHRRSSARSRTCPASAAPWPSGSRVGAMWT